MGVFAFRKGYAANHAMPRCYFHMTHHQSGRIAEGIFHLLNIIINVNNNKWETIAVVHQHTRMWYYISCSLIFCGQFSYPKQLTSVPIKILIGNDSLILLLSIESLLTWCEITQTSSIRWNWYRFRNRTLSNFALCEPNFRLHFGCAR